MKYIVDRIEGELVVCENENTKEMENFKKELFPEEVKAGDIVEKSGEKFEIKKEELNKLRKDLESMFHNLFEDNKDDKNDKE